VEQLPDEQWHQVDLSQQGHRGARRPADTWVVSDGQQPVDQLAGAPEGHEPASVSGRSSGTPAELEASMPPPPKWNRERFERHVNRKVALAVRDHSPEVADALARIIHDDMWKQAEKQTLVYQDLIEHGKRAK